MSNSQVMPPTDLSVYRQGYRDGRADTLREIQEAEESLVEDDDEEEEEEEEYEDDEDDEEDDDDDY